VEIGLKIVIEQKRKQSLNSFNYVFFLGVD
jgi:hypothetical protein